MSKPRNVVLLQMFPYVFIGSILFTVLDFTPLLTDSTKAPKFVQRICVTHKNMYKKLI